MAKTLTEFYVNKLSSIAQEIGFYFDYPKNGRGELDQTATTEEIELSFVKSMRPFINNNLQDWITNEAMEENERKLAEIKAGYQAKIDELETEFKKLQEMI